MTDQSVWVCPNCKRTFRGHVFGEGTSMSGPICNTCCVPLIPPDEQEGEEEEVAAGRDAKSAGTFYEGY